MLVLIATTKTDYVTELPDGMQDFIFQRPVKLDPKKTCEIFRIMRPGKDGRIEQNNSLIPMENQRTGDLSRLAFSGEMLLNGANVIACTAVNPKGPLAQAFNQQMGRTIIDPGNIALVGKMGNPRKATVQ